jgi:hypothetical protein
LLVVSGFCNAQSVAYLSGKVLDLEKSPLSSAFLKVSETGISAVTDLDGNYTLKVPANTVFTVQISHFDEGTQRKLGPFNEGQKVAYNFILNKTASIGGVTVSGGIDRGPLIKIKPKEIERFANTAGFEQQLKLIGLGINTSGGDQSSAYSVRGGNFDENLVYIDDIEIYRPFLVRSGQQEGLSVINPDMVDNVQFSAGGFQAKYGDKLSSVLDIKYRQPDSFAATIQASLLGANIHFEDRSKNKRFSYLIGARYRSNQYLLGTLDVQGEYKPRFYDIQTLLRYKLRADLTLSYLTTLSQNKYAVAPESRQTSFGNVNSALSLNIAFGGGEVMQYTTWMNGLNLEYKPTERLELKLISSSYTTSEREHFTVEGAYRLSELDNNIGSDDFANEKRLLGVGYFIDHARNDLEAQVYTVSQKGRYTLGKSTLNWGLGYTNETINDKLKEWRYNDSSGFNITTRQSTGAPNEIVLDEFVKAKINIASYRLNAYIQNAHVFDKSSNFKATYGIRTNYWSFNEENVISPRLQVSYEPNKRSNDTLRKHLRDSLIERNFKYSQDTLNMLYAEQGKRDWVWRFAAGYYYQPPFYRELRGIDGVINPNLKAQQSIHYVLGGDLNFLAWNRPFKFISEVYYKHLDRMVPYVVDNVRIRYLADNTSQGYSTGIDARVNGEFIEGVESWFNISVMQTQERLYYMDENGQEQLSDWLRRPTDQRVNFSILFQDELPSNPSYKMNLGLVYGSNMPFYYNAEERQKTGFTIPAYRRVDIGFSKVLIDANSEKRPNWLRNTESLWVSLEVFNLLQVNNTSSFILIKDFANTVYGVPNYLTGRRINLRFIMKI